MDGKDLMRCLFHTNLKQAVKMLTHQLVRLGETKEMARSGSCWFTLYAPQTNQPVAIPPF
mgnify:FL=1